MDIIQTKIEGLFIIKTKKFSDLRGEFIKTFNEDFFKKNNLNYSFVESYYSISRRNVIRGMHFQIPPFDHVKIVYVPRGRIIDVVLDIRKQSTTYQKYFSTELSDENNKILYIPKGCAHGFKSLRDNTIVIYLQTSCYNEKYDKGIKYDSFGFEWKIKSSILSERDKNLPNLENYKSPF